MSTNSDNWPEQYYYGSAMDLPERSQCGLCDAKDAEIERWRARAEKAEEEANEARRIAQDARNSNEAIHRELDRLGAPRRQVNGFGYTPLGRLRRLSVNECGEGLKNSLMEDRIREAGRTEKAEARVKELEGLALDALVQGASYKDGIDHMCISIWVDLCNYFEGHGQLEKVAGRVYRLVKGDE